jgi:DNA-binding MarR family transcriptional regulator
MSEIKKDQHHHRASLNNQSKDTSHVSELQTIFQYLQYHIATASMVSEATGIKQKNITRHKRDLEKASMLWEIEKKACQTTGYKAWYLTTNNNLAPTNYKQLKLWGG